MTRTLSFADLFSLLFSSLVLLGMAAVALSVAVTVLFNLIRGESFIERRRKPRSTQSQSTRKQPTTF